MSDFNAKGQTTFAVYDIHDVLGEIAIGIPLILRGKKTFAESICEITLIIDSLEKPDKNGKIKFQGRVDEKRAYGYIQKSPVRTSGKLRIGLL